MRRRRFGVSCARTGKFARGLQFSPSETMSGVENREVRENRISCLTRICKTPNALYDVFVSCWGVWFCRCRACVGVYVRVSVSACGCVGPNAPHVKFAILSSVSWPHSHDCVSWGRRLEHQTTKDTLSRRRQAHTYGHVFAHLRPHPRTSHQERTRSKPSRRSSFLVCALL